MKIAVVDDDKIWRKRAEEKIRSYYKFPVVVESFPSGESFLAEEGRIVEVKGDPFDIVFLDVEMEGGLDGFETTIQFKNRHPETPVILLTAHGEFSRRGYRVKAFRYLEKQYLDELDEALESIGLINPTDIWIQLPYSDGSENPVRVFDICYIEAAGHGCLVHMVKETVRTPLSLQKMEKLLKREEDDHFYRCHQGFIVNWKYAEEIDDLDVILKDGTRIPVSRRRLHEAKNTFIKYSFRRASR